MTGAAVKQTDSELYYQLALTLIPGIGDITAKILATYFGSAQDIFRHRKRSKLRLIPGIGEKLAESIAGFRDFSRAEEELRFIEKHGIRPLFYLNDDYPSRLRVFDDAPVMLYYLGTANLENPRIVGIVGTRKSSDYGKAFTEKLVEELKDTGALVLSGLALGIDVQAHRAALRQQLPTVGVVGHGLDRMYPAQHNAIAQKMLANGGLLTRFMSRSSPDRENFPKRNRIVAGLCDVLVVAESPVKGGAMITAALANEYNKDVMALPGRISDLGSQGCNHLLRINRASLITCAADLFELMNWDLSSNTRQANLQAFMQLDREQQAVVTYIRKRSKVGIDELATALQADPGSMSLVLLDLEFKGLIRQLPGKCFELA